jgi:hypothetical protein
MPYARQVRSAHHPQGGRGGCFRWGQPETVPKAGHPYQLLLLPTLTRQTQTTHTNGPLLCW